MHLTYTLTLTEDRHDGDLVHIEVIDADLDALTATQRASIDAIGMIVDAVVRDRVDHPADDAPERVTDLAGTAERAPVVRVDPPEAFVPAEPKRAAKPGQPTGPKSGPHRKGSFAAPGTITRRIMEVLADHGGRWGGSAIDLGTTAGATRSSAPKLVRQLADRGLVSIEKAGPRKLITAVALTGDGWRHVRPDGRPPSGPLRSIALTEPEPATEGERPPAIDLASLPREGRKAFDPDRVRAAAAGAL